MSHLPTTPCSAFCRFFKLFPMIAAEQEGLDAYAKFVCGIVSSRSKGSLQQQGELVRLYKISETAR